MKRIFAVLILVLVTMLALGSTATAQTNDAPNNFNLYKSWSIPFRGYSDSVSVKAFANRVDTLFFRHWANRTANAYQTPVFIRVAAANKSSITLDVNDTSSVGIVVKARPRSSGYGAAGAWATIATDSIQNTGASASSGLVKEISLVDTDSDLFDAVDNEMMIITTVNAWTLGVSGNERLRVRLNWVP